MMRTCRAWTAIIVVLAGLIGPAPHLHAQFTSGNIAVLRIGDGTTTLSSASARGALIEINKSTGAATGYSVSIPVPTSANTDPGATFSGDSITAPFLHRSTDGNQLDLIGYSATTGTSNIRFSTSSSANRTLVHINSSGTVSTQRLTDNTFDQRDARSVISDGSHYWLGGNASSDTNRGVRYVSSGSATSSTRLVNNEIRDVNIFNNRLLYSTPSEILLAGSSPPPTSGTPTSTSIASGFSGSVGFYFFDRDSSGDSALGGLDTLYVTTGSLINKLEWNGSSWTGRGTYDSGQLGTPFAITGELNGSNVDLYVTDTSNKLAKIRDTSAFGNPITASDVWGTPFNAGSNYILRGVDFVPVPVPEPASVLAIATASFGLVAFVRNSWAHH